MNLVFVIGSGRCGTNMVGEILASNPDWYVDIEQQPQFGLGTKLATQVWEQFTFNDLCDIYREKTEKYENYAYKTHPNLWIADKLQDMFPHAKFIYCQRNTDDVVKSMIKHNGVMSWYQKPMNHQLRKFLGLDIHSTSNLLAKRVEAHNEKYNDLKDRINSIIFDYDKAQLDPPNEVAKIEAFLGYSFDHTIIKT